MTDRPDPTDTDEARPDWPSSEPEIGWEQFARNWQDTARHYAQNADYWRARAGSRPEPADTEPTAEDIAAYILEGPWSGDVLYEFDIQRVLDARAALIREQKGDDD